MSDWYEIRAAAESAEVYIYEQIGEDLQGEGIGARRFVEELASLQVPRLDLHINSPGGNVFDGQAIYNALRRHPATVTSYIDGVAASIASVVALAGDRVVMAGNALFMVHDPFALTIGAAADHRKTADMLDQVAQTIRRIYVAKTGADEADIAAAMAAETWYSAEEAAAAGFVDEVTEPLRLAAQMRWDWRALGYRRAPVMSSEITSTDDDTSTADSVAETEPAPAAEAAPASELVLAGRRLFRFRKR